jgi:hypothetical protein
VNTGVRETPVNLSVGVCKTGAFKDKEGGVIGARAVVNELGADH